MAPAAIVHITAAPPNYSHLFNLTRHFAIERKHLLRISLAHTDRTMSQVVIRWFRSSDLYFYLMYLSVVITFDLITLCNTQGGHLMIGVAINDLKCRPLQAMMM